MKEWFQQFLKKIIPQITRISAFSEKIDSCNFRRKEFSGLCRKDFWNFWRKFLFQLRSIFCLSEKKNDCILRSIYTERSNISKRIFFQVISYLDYSLRSCRREGDRIYYSRIINVIKHGRISNSFNTRQEKFFLQHSFIIHLIWRF